MSNNMAFGIGRVIGALLLLIVVAGLVLQGAFPILLNFSHFFAGVLAIGGFIVHTLFTMVFMKWGDEFIENMVDEARGNEESMKEIRKMKTIGPIWRAISIIVNITMSTATEGLL